MSGVDLFFSKGVHMEELKTIAFIGVEKRIRDARLAQSAMIGQAIGNGLAEAWFGAQRCAARLDLWIKTKFAALKHMVAEPRHPANQRRITTTRH